jgi:predicted O-methyltransferase YrrM
MRPAEGIVFMKEMVLRTWRRLPKTVRLRLRPFVDKVTSAGGRIRTQPLVIRVALAKAKQELPDGLSTIASAPSEMSMEERLFLYALVRGCAPRRVLEIGTSEGGSALIISAALNDNDNDGHIATVDPLPRIEFDYALFHGRLHIVQGFSPEAISTAVRIIGGPFDFILIDGVHIHDQAKKDLEGALAFAAEHAYILLHDSFHFGVSEAIREVVEQEPLLHDCGYVCNRPRPVGDLATHAGFRLLRWGPDIVDPTPLVTPLWQSMGKVPPHDSALLNHDIYWCQYVEPCARCKAAGATVPS